MMADEDVIAGTGEQEPVEGSQVEAVDAGGAEADAERDAAQQDAPIDDGSMPAAAETELETLDAFLTRNESARIEHEALVAERARVAENAGAEFIDRVLKEAGYN